MGKQPAAANTRKPLPPRLLGSVEKPGGKGFHKRHLFTANVYDSGCKRLRWRMQTFTMADANVYDGGCKRLREKRQCTASEMGKTGTEIVSPILDKR